MGEMPLLSVFGMTKRLRLCQSRYSDTVPELESLSQIMTISLIQE
jgi:hypothetical protein